MRCAVYCNPTTPVPTACVRLYSFEAFSYVSFDNKYPALCSRRVCRQGLHVCSMAPSFALPARYGALNVAALIKVNIIWFALAYLCHRQYNDAGWRWSRCQVMIDRASLYGGNRLMFVPTHAWWPTAAGGIDHFCIMRGTDGAFGGFVRAW